MYAVCSSSAGDDGLAGLLARVQLTATVVMCTPPLLQPLLAGWCSSLFLSFFLSLLRALYNGYRAALKQGPEGSSAELHRDRIYGCCSHGGNGPPGPFELAKCKQAQASMEVVVLVPEWDDGRTDGGLDGGPRSCVLRASSWVGSEVLGKGSGRSTMGCPCVGCVRTGGAEWPACPCSPCC